MPIEWIPFGDAFVTVVEGSEIRVSGEGDKWQFATTSGHAMSVQMGFSSAREAQDAAVAFVTSQSADDGSAVDS